MSSSEKTTRLNLNQWVESDKPTMYDFNDDNLKIDSSLDAHYSDMEIHITPEEHIKYNTPYAFCTYAGNGEPTQEVELNLDFVPRIAFVYALGAPPGVIDIPNDTHYNFFGIATQGGSMTGLALSEKKLIAESASIPFATYELRSYNMPNRIYAVICFR